VGPLDFIPLAEENGLIERIGRWVLDTACADAARWVRQGHDLRVAVNLSPVQFASPTLMQTIVEVLTLAGLAPERLELEVTEGTLMEHTAVTANTLRALRNHGVRVALDDFGTGYSSLAYLTRMPINNIKVDRSFVNGLLHSGESEAIVRAILAMARSLHIVVTAEGVETLEQMQTLAAMSCNLLQGYYFSQPVVAARVPGLLAHHWSMDGMVADTASGAAVDETTCLPVGR
jgi:EAL domain-containing protein (putative c-di-GMP-specific phosphodiesterase class I)